MPIETRPVIERGGRAGLRPLTMAGTKKTGGSGDPLTDFSERASRTVPALNFTSGLIRLALLGLTGSDQQ